MASGSAIWKIWNAMVRLSHFCHTIVTHRVASVTIQTETYTDNTQVNITITVARKHK